MEVEDSAISTAPRHVDNPAPKMRISDILKLSSIELFFILKHKELKEF